MFRQGMKTSITIAVLVLLFFSSAFAQEVVDWRKLIKFIPMTFNGIPRNDELLGDTERYAGDIVTELVQTYAKSEDGPISEIVITNSNSTEMDWQALLAKLPEAAKDEEEILRQVEVKGYPALEHCYTPDNEVYIYVRINSSVLISVLQEGTDKFEAARKIAGQLDLKGIDEVTNGK